MKAHIQLYTFKSGNRCRVSEPGTCEESVTKLLVQNFIFNKQFFKKTNIFQENEPVFLGSTTIFERKKASDDKKECDF